MLMVSMVTNASKTTPRILAINSPGFFSAIERGVVFNGVEGAIGVEGTRLEGDSPGFGVESGLVDLSKLWGVFDGFIGLKHSINFNACRPWVGTVENFGFVWV